MYSNGNFLNKLFNDFLKFSFYHLIIDKQKSMINLFWLKEFLCGTLKTTEMELTITTE
jgi:hypothetical protein